MPKFLNELDPADVEAARSVEVLGRDEGQLALLVQRR